ncbi:MAG TPA: cation-transporting P-type ATPase, partial [Mycobacteriales bacterium]
SGAWSAVDLTRRPVIPPVSHVPWHLMPAQTVLDRVGAHAGGLTTDQARRRRRSVDERQPPPTTLASAFLTELANPLTPILIGGAGLSASIGAVVDAGIIVSVTAASALLGAVQRTATERAVSGLLERSATVARVYRDGEQTMLPSADLVVGDVVVVEPGDVVPADCRILTAAALEVDESSLTGESMPVTKCVDPVIAREVAERRSMLYESTTVAAGRGTGVVVATGGGTEAGRSMAATQTAAPTAGVEARLAQITRTTLPIALGSAGAVMVAGLVRGYRTRDTVSAGVALAVASVPECLPFLVSAAQLAAARRLSARGALVRNPRTIEALGRVNVLCFDKTGTLTEGRIALRAISDGRREQALDELDGSGRAVLAAGLRSTPQAGHGQRLAHSTDVAVLRGAAGVGVDRADDRPAWRPVRSLPFEPNRAYHATLGELGDTSLVSVKGAPELVIPRCTSWIGEPLDAHRRSALMAETTRLARSGYRVLAVAERSGPVPVALDDRAVSDLVFVGFLLFADPVRASSGASVRDLRNAGVQVVMITGDHPDTAEAIATELDVRNGGVVVTGAELDELDDDALDALLPRVAVVARGTPAHKVRVVHAFQRLGRTVAMTGDGANDAAAIRLADVGIALGRRGTPAARAAADLVVVDDRVETILAALVEGRAMWGSVRRALGILVGGNLGEIAFTLLGAGATGVSPLSARQLLLVNLLTDLAPALAVALRPPEVAATGVLLAEGPEVSLGTALTREVSVRACATAAGATSAWVLARLTGRNRRARTVGLVALVGTQLGQTLLAGGRSPSVVGASLGSAVVLAAVVQTPGLSQFFGCTPLGPFGWLTGCGAAAGATAGTVLLTRPGLQPARHSATRPTRQPVVSHPVSQPQGS